MKSRCNALKNCLAISVAGLCLVTTLAAANDNKKDEEENELQFRPGGTWGPTDVPHLLFQTAIWAGFFAELIPDNGLIDFVTGRFRHRSRRYLELSGGVVAASLVARADMMMKIALMQVAASHLPYKPGGTFAPETMSPSTPTPPQVSSLSTNNNTAYLASSSGDYFLPAPSDPQGPIQLTPNYLFFLTQAPMVYVLLKAGGAFKINDYYTAVMISATSIYSNVGFLLILLLGQLAVKLVVGALLGRTVHTSMASAYLHTLSIMTVPMAMHGAFYFTQEELLTLGQKPTNHNVVVGIALTVFVLGLLGTLASNGIPSPVNSSRRVLSWWASEVSPTRGERLHWAWLVSMWLFSAISGMLGGNWVGAIFDGRPPDEQEIFNYGSAALYFLSAVCNAGAVILIPESRKLSITAVMSDVFLFVFCFPQINPNIVGAMCATVLFIWAIRALIVHLILPFIDSRTHIPIPEAHAAALREAGESLLDNSDGSDSDDDDDSQGGDDNAPGIQVDVPPPSNSVGSSNTLTSVGPAATHSDFDADFNDDSPRRTSPAPSQVSASAANISPKGSPKGHTTTGSPSVSPKGFTTTGGGSPAQGQATTTTLIPPPIRLKGTLDSPVDFGGAGPGSGSYDDGTPNVSLNYLSRSGSGAFRGATPRDQGGDMNVELQEILPGRGRVVGDNPAPPPAWIRHLPAPAVEIQVHKRRTSILRDPNRMGAEPASTILPTPIDSPAGSAPTSTMTSPRGSFMSPSPSMHPSSVPTGGPLSIRDSFTLPPRQMLERSFSGRSLRSPSTPGDAGLRRTKSVQFLKKDIEDPKKYGAPKKGRKSKQAFPIDYLSASAEAGGNGNSSSPSTAGGGSASPLNSPPGFGSPRPGSLPTSPNLLGSPSGGGGSFARMDYIPPKVIQLQSRPVFPIEPPMGTTGSASPSPAQPNASSAVSPPDIGLGRLRSSSSMSSAASGSPGMFSSPTGGGGIYSPPTRARAYTTPVVDATAAHQAALDDPSL